MNQYRHNEDEMTMPTISDPVPGTAGKLGHDGHLFSGLSS